MILYDIITYSHANSNGGLVRLQLLGHGWVITANNYIDAIT